MNSGDTLQVVHKPDGPYQRERAVVETRYQYLLTQRLEFGGLLISQDDYFSSSSLVCACQFVGDGRGSAISL